MTVALYGPQDLERLRTMADKKDTPDVPEDQTSADDAEVVADASADEQDHTLAWHGREPEPGQRVGEGGRIEPDPDYVAPEEAE